MPCTRACKILGGGECHGLIVWASVTVVKTLLKIKHADGFELNGVRVLPTRACKWIEVEILWSSGMPTRLSLGSLSLVLDLTMKKGVGLPCTNWSGAGAALLMSPRQGETSKYEGKCVAWQAGSQQNVHVRPPHEPRRCVNE